MDTKETLPEKLRRNLEILANTPSSIDMGLWNEFANSVLKAANVIGEAEKQKGESPKYTHNQKVKIKIDGFLEGVSVSVVKELIVKTIDLVEYTEGYSRQQYYRYYLVEDLVFDQKGKWVKEKEII